MSGRPLEAGLVLLLCAAALPAWVGLNRRVRARRRSRLVLADPGGAWAAGVVTVVVDGLRRLCGPARAGRPRWLVPELLLLPAGLGLAQLLGSPVPAVAATLLAVPLHHLRQRRRTLRETRARAAAIIELCAALAGELRSGATPEQALLSVVGRDRLVGDLIGRLGAEAVARLAAGQYGADVPAAFRWLAERPGGAGAAAIGACWQVTTDSGTGLATVLDQVAEALRAERALEEEIQSELAGPRTTAWLLAALPAFGLLLGGALGAQPVRVLLHTPLGLGCLGTGAVLEAAGLLWTGRIVRDAQHVAGGAGGGVAVATRGRRRGRAAGAAPWQARRGGRGAGGAGWAGAGVAEVAW